MSWWFLAAAAWAAPECDTITLGDVLAVPPPAVIVLGERHGTQPDLRRAGKIVRQLSARAPTTVALEAVYAEKQDVLDRYAAGEIYWEDLPTELDWERDWGFPFRPYAALLTASDDGTRVVAAGLPEGGAPSEAEFPVPGGYMGVLRDVMGEHPIPLSMQSDFVRSLAWRDYAMARESVEEWNGKGYLVILAGREHVVGGKGVAWQAGLLTRTPVHAFTLAYATDPPCYPGDRIWKPGPFEPRAPQ